MLAIGQVVLFDAICVIDTAASAVSKTNDTHTKGKEKSSQILEVFNSLEELDDVQNFFTNAKLNNL